MHLRQCLVVNVNRNFAFVSDIGITMKGCTCLGTRILWTHTSATELTFARRA